MVQRYRPDELEMIGMHPESDGDYVDYADYTAIERELQMIDELMARRPALDDCKTRYDKISKAITTAAQKDALERERDELQEELHQKLMYSGGEISRLEADNALLMKRLEVACHVKADDKVGFDFAILDKMDALERERDELKEENETLRCHAHDAELAFERNAELVAENAGLKRKLA